MSQIKTTLRKVYNKVKKKEWIITLIPKEKTRYTVQDPSSLIKWARN